MISDDILKACIRINEYFAQRSKYFSLKKVVRKAAVKDVVCDTKTYKPRFKSHKY